jgi:Domain of Unknown Function (DUF1080)
VTRALAGCALVLFLALPASAAPGDRWLELFDGRSKRGWALTGPGSFTVENGALVSHGGTGLLWYQPRRFRDFVLEVDWRVAEQCDNSGVFVRFPGRPRSPQDAIRSGYEVQIDDCDPRGPAYRTGGIYDRAAASRLASRPAGSWNRFRITAARQHYTVVLNGRRVTDYDGHRGIVGYVGLQNHDDGSRVEFRRIRALPLG